MSIFIEKSSRYHGEKRITITGNRSLSDWEQIDGTLIFEGVLTANATIKMTDQIGGYWFIKNSTSGGYSLVLTSAGGASITVQNGDFVAVVFLRGVGLQAIQGNAVYFRDQPYSGAVPGIAQIMTYGSGTWYADRPRTVTRVVTGTGAQTVDPQDHVLLVSGTSTATVTLNLPDANLAGDGAVFVIRDIGDAGAHTLTIDAYGAQLIDGAATAEITTSQGALSIVAHNGHWYSTSKI